MNPRFCSVGLAVAILLTICLSLHARPWTDSTGKRTVEAEFVSLADGKVTLKKTDGKTVTMALEKLSAADQKVAKELAAKEAPAAGDSAVAIELVSLTASKPVEDFDGSLTFAPQLSGGGTSLTLLLTSKAPHFIGFDPKSSRLVAFTDDAGTDLAASAEEGSFLGVERPFGAGVSSDGKKCQVCVTVSGTPKSGATKLVLDATLGLICGKEETSVEQKDVAMAPQSKIEIGPIPLVVESAEEQEFGDIKFVVGLTSSEPRDAIKAIEFLAEDGTIIESQAMGSYSLGFNEEKTYQTSHGLKAKPDKVTVRITYYADVETITIPVKIETGVGF